MQLATETALPLDSASRMRVRDLATTLGYLTDDDLALLAGVKLSTLEAWRKRHTGPSYVLIGANYLYPVAAVADFLASKLRERGVEPVRGLL